MRPADGDRVIYQSSRTPRDVTRKGQIATGRRPMRAAHIHAVVTAGGHRPLIHVFDAASDYLDSDAVFGVKGPSYVTRARRSRRRRVRDRLRPGTVRLSALWKLAEPDAGEPEAEHLLRGGRGKFA
jgi:hypothetical protein